MNRKNFLTVYTLITIVSVLVPLIVFVLMLLPQNYNILSIDRGVLPFFHACINACTFVFLILGFIFIKNKMISLHKKTMITCLFLSIIFLVSYVISKISNAPVKYGGDNIYMKGIYFFTLISHIILSMAIIPLALISIYKGLINNIKAHKKISKITLPIWLYVSFTGVLVYLFMKPYY